MKHGILLLFAVATAAGCKAPQFIQAGEKDGVSVDYRWNINAAKPPELLLKIANKSDSAQHLHLELDLSYQAFTVEELTADTCIPAGRTFNGKLNGIYFIPKALTSAQAASPDCKVQVNGFTTENAAHCP